MTPGHGAQEKGGGRAASATLLSAGQTAPGVLYSVLSVTLQNSYKPAGGTTVVKAFQVHQRRTEEEKIDCCST